MFYKCDNFYDKSAEAGIYFADPEIGIDWKIDVAQAIISEKDHNQPMLLHARNGF